MIDFSARLIPPQSIEIMAGARVLALVPNTPDGRAAAASVILATLTARFPDGPAKCSRCGTVNLGGKTCHRCGVQQ